MASALDPLKARLVAVVCEGRGTDGLVGPDALRCSIPAGRFRKGIHGAPLRDPAYVQGAFDRATRWTWLGLRDEDDPNNDVDQSSLQQVRVLLEVGYIIGAGNESDIVVAAGTTETAAAAVRDPEARAFNDAIRIRNALGCQELVQGGTDPTLYGVQRLGETTFEDLGKGHGLSSTTYLLHIGLDLSKTYDW